MKKSILAFVGAVLLCISGCSVTKDWVISTVKDIAVQVADSQLEKVNEKYVVPEIARLETKLGEKVDKNGDGTWTADEIQDEMQKMWKPALQSTITTLTTNTDQKLGEKLQGLATKDDNIRGLIMLFVAWLLTKLGIKIGPAGLQSLKSYMTKPDEPVKPNL
jgi:hypothetical protein